MVTEESGRKVGFSKNIQRRWGTVASHVQGSGNSPRVREEMAVGRQRAQKDEDGHFIQSSRQSITDWRRCTMMSAHLLIPQATAITSPTAIISRPNVCIHNHIFSSLPPTHKGRDRHKPPIQAMPQ